LTVLRNSNGDFQDRQVFLYVDGELWGKVKYGRPVSREIPPGRHKVRAFNTLFSQAVRSSGRQVVRLSIDLVSTLASPQVQCARRQGRPRTRN